MLAQFVIQNNLPFLSNTSKVSFPPIIHSPMKTSFLLTIIIFLLGIRASYAQKQNLVTDTTLARKWYEQALGFQQKAEYDSAKIRYEKAALLYKKHRQWERQLECKTKLFRSLASLGKYEEAAKQADQTLSQCLEKLEREHPTTADALHNIGMVHYLQGDYDKALAYYQQGLQIRRKVFGEKHSSVANSYNNMGSAYYLKGNYDEALAYYQRDIQITLKLSGEDHPDLASSYGNMGNVYYAKGEYPQALAFLQKAVNIRKKALGEEHPKLASFYNSMGNVYSYQGEQDKALEYNEKALHLWRKSLGEDHPDVAAAYHNIGGIYEEKGEHEKAMEYYQKAAQLWLISLGEDHPSVATAYYNLGSVYETEKEYEKALRFLQKSLQIRQKAFGEAQTEVADCYSKIGGIYESKGEYVQALVYYQKDLRILLESLGPVHPSIAATYNNLGSAYHSKGAYKKALQELQYAILANVTSFQDTLISRNPVLSDPASIFLDGSYLLQTLRFKGRAMEKLYEQSQSLSDLQLAYETYCVADTLVQQMQRSYDSEGDQVELMSKAVKAYKSILPVCLKLHQLTKNPAYLDKAFYFAERGKANVLSANLAESKAKNFAGIADSLLNHDQQLRLEIAQARQLVTEEFSNGEGGTDSTRLSQYQGKLFALHRQHENLISQLEKDYPFYHNLKYQEATISPEQLQGVLDKKSALVEYVIGDSLLHVFTLTHKAFEVQSLAIDSSFRRSIASFRNAILSQDEDLYQQTAYQLYQLLLPQSLPQSIKRLIIIPEGELTTLPFEALLTEANREKSAKPNAYLLNKYTVSYAYSAKLLYERLTQPKEVATKKLLALAPVFTDSLTNAVASSNRGVLVHHQRGNMSNPVINKASNHNSSYNKNNQTRSANTSNGLVSQGWLLNGQYVAPLLSSRREVESIAQLFKRNGGSAKVYLYNQAEEERLKSDDISNFNYIHLATHGFVNESYPELSGLLLAQDSTSEEDGILYTGEIYNFRLNADLVTLSACETGLGKIANGEGVIGLSRALLYAGASNLIVSFWQVSDESTADLMESFYSSLLSGRDKATALQQSKRKMLRKGKYSHPFYWAPFVLIGK